MQYHFIGRALLGIFLDTETNGLNFRKHRILDIAFKIIDLNTKEILASFNTVICQPDDIWNSSDKASLAVNGFKKEDLFSGVSEKEAADKIKDIFKKQEISRKTAVFICQNPSFDRSFFSQLIPPEEQEKLFWPYHWLDLASMFFAMYWHEKRAFPLNIGLSKDKIAAYYGLPPEGNPHKALAGVNHLIDCYFAVMKTS